MKTIRIHPNDNVAVALTGLPKGEQLPGGLTVAEDIPAGHKIALRDIRAGDCAVKYGYPIGAATADIAAGTRVHCHNLRSRLNEREEIAYNPAFSDKNAADFAGEPDRFMGYLRPDGRAATRNELWILPLTGCVNGIASALVRENASLTGGTLEGIHAFPHPYGCSQLGGDHEMTRRLLAALAKHPNAGGVLILGLGCENLTMEQFRGELGQIDKRRIRFLVCQESENEMAEGSRLLSELSDYAKGIARESLPVSKLVAGLKCGGSDGFSGVTANPAAGVFTDILTAKGGTAILTETPEMFGAERLLFSRCAGRTLFDKALGMAESFKEYYSRHGLPVYENPSPGNKDGGISTLEDKSLGCVQKGGSATIRDVIDYGEQVKTAGLTLLNGPGNDLVSVTALAAAGAQIILFTTGRGTPFGAPVPTVKIASNSALFARKGRWTDFNAGSAAAGESLADTGARLYRHVLRTAGGERTRNEENGAREIAIWKNGVTL